MRKAIAVMITLTIVLIAIPIWAIDNATMLRAKYETALSNEIAVCQKKSKLFSARSPAYWSRGSRETYKTLFLKKYRNQLIDGMMASQLEAKKYKVHQYLDRQFNNNFTVK
ncbi:hypothetical protein DSCW_36090 [Desulfosarcina widdelii]|uniref:Uncharacterized protein n=1 Tax=Desulfosarcina widdelii TaxID=947919 RepID=A0A5K7Z2F3_9BACT|nr:hypothetical protein [Desulfosarcina widdelii]BBO76192.1 hypothetical protein DSCW_36090 [Desulfosarcina widdelii]